MKKEFLVCLSMKLDCDAFNLRKTDVYIMLLWFRILWDFPSYLSSINPGLPWITQCPHIRDMPASQASKYWQHPINHRFGVCYICRLFKASSEFHVIKTKKWWKQLFLRGMQADVCIRRGRHASLGLRISDRFSYFAFGIIRPQFVATDTSVPLIF